MSYTLAYTGAEIDALLGKIDAIFVAEYGSTIYSEVTAAIAAGNKVIVANAGKVFVYAGTDDNSGYVFTQSGPNAAKPNATYVTLSTGNVWSTATVDLATLQQFYASLMEDTASGSIASFPDGAEGVPVKELTADIEPIQDLHGQASPWPAGGGKNKLPYPYVTASGSVIAGVTYTVNTDGSVSVSGTASGGAAFTLNEMSVTAGASYIFTIGTSVTNIVGSINGYDENETALFSDVRVNVNGLTINTNDYPTLTKVVYYLKRNTNGSVSGTVYPMIRLSTEADATFAPYSNICPISGYTGAEISVANDNMLIPNSGQSYYLNAGTWYYQSFVIGDASQINSRIEFLIDGVWTYISAPQTYDDGNLVASGHSQGWGNYDQTQTIVTTKPYEARINTTVWGIVSGKRQLSLSPVLQTAYVEPKCATYSVSWTDHGTVYKGTAEYKGDGEWEITATSAEATYNGSEGWANDSDAARGFYHELADLAKLLDYTGIVCDKLKSFAFQFSDDYKSSVQGITGYQDFNNYYPNTNWLYAKGGGATTAAEFKTWLAANPITVVYPLRTPQTFTVTGPTPETLLGDNNIWSNTGDVSVKYRANTALYIEKKLGE